MIEPKCFEMKQFEVSNTPMQLLVGLFPKQATMVIMLGLKLQGQIEHHNLLMLGNLGHIRLFNENCYKKTIKCSKQ